MSIIMDRLHEGKFVLIAEVGVNYYDIAKEEAITPLQAAKQMIREAKEAGVHAVKFQSYKAGTLAAKASPSYWDTTEEPTTSQYELFQKFDSFNREDYQALSDYAKEIGIEFFSTAFDFASADYLDDMMADSLIEDCLEIKRILIASINTTKENMAKKEAAK